VGLKLKGGRFRLRNINPVKIFKRRNWNLEISMNKRQRNWNSMTILSF
jgi:hypothetical protein